MPKRIPLSEVAARMGTTESALKGRITRGTFPAPVVIFRDPGKARWDETVAVVNPTTAWAPGATMRHEVHVAELLDEVRYFAWKNGHADIAQHMTGRMKRGREFPLGARVSAIRTAYKQGRLPRKVAAEFEHIPGWMWDYLESTWRGRFDSVVSRWPDRTTSDDRAWLTVQRRRFEQLRPEWQEAMREVDGLLEPHRFSRVPEFLDAARLWLAEHPGQSMADMSYSAVVMLDGTMVNVGRRVTYYRRRKLGLDGSTPLPADEAREIESLPGGSWEMSERHRHGGHVKTSQPRARRGGSRSRRSGAA